MTWIILKTEFSILLVLIFENFSVIYDLLLQPQPVGNNSMLLLQELQREGIFLVCAKYTI